MNLYIEIKDRLPYALVPKNPENAFEIAYYFNEHALNDNVEAGTHPFTFVPEPDEFERWMRREKVMFATQGPQTVRIDEISSILISK